MEKNTWIGLSAAFLCLAFVFLTQSSKPNDTAALEQETMRVHDEAMKEMADMNRVGRALKKEMETLDSLTPRHRAIRQALSQMKSAEAEMYDWMSNYQAPDKLPAEEAKRYLEDQKQKIEKNRQDLKAALEAGEKLLKE